MKLNSFVFALFISLSACTTIYPANGDEESQIKSQEIEKNLEIDDLFLRKSQRIDSVAAKSLK